MNLTLIPPHIPQVFITYPDHSRLIKKTELHSTNSTQFNCLNSTQPNQLNSMKSCPPTQLNLLESLNSPKCCTQYPTSGQYLLDTIKKIVLLYILQVLSISCSLDFMTRPSTIITFLSTLLSLSLSLSLLLSLSLYWTIKTFYLLLL